MLMRLPNDDGRFFSPASLYFASIAARWGQPRTFFLFFLALLVVLAAASGGRTEEGQPTNTSLEDFSIPGEPLASALQKYSQQSGVELFYESGITRGLRSTALEGHFTAKVALQALLAGSGFTVHYNRRDAVSLSLPSLDDQQLPQGHLVAKASLSLDALRVTAPAEAVSDTQLREFGDAVQNEVTDALTKNSEIRSGNYRIRVKLWIDPTRVIRRAEMARTTGDSSRDAAITAALQGLTISRAPPLGMPQPVRIIVAVGAP